MTAEERKAVWRLSGEHMARLNVYANLEHKAALEADKRGAEEYRKRSKQNYYEEYRQMLEKRKKAHDD